MVNPFTIDPLTITITDGIDSLPDRFVPRFEVFVAKPSLTPISTPSGGAPVLLDPVTALQAEKMRTLFKQPSYAEKNLGQYANGSLLGGSGNQYLDPVVAKANTDAMAKVNGMYAGAGRIGGGANAQDIARAVSETVRT